MFFSAGTGVFSSGISGIMEEGADVFLGWNGSISVTRADGSDRVRTGADVEQDLDCRVNPSSPQEYQE